MASTRMATLSALACILYFLNCSPCTEARFFSYADPEVPDMPCILVDTNFTLDVTAYSNTTGQQVAHVTRSSDDKYIVVLGKCESSKYSQLALDFGEGGSYMFNFYHSWQTSSDIFPEVSFIPKKIFGSDVPVLNTFTFTQKKGFQMDNVFRSYMCRARQVLDYTPDHSTPGGFYYKVKVTMEGVHAQGLGVEDGKFGHAQTCKLDGPVTRGIRRLVEV